MKIVTNPHTDAVSIIFGPPGAAKKYTIESGKSASFPDEANDVADYFLETYGFLTVETKQGEAPKVNKLSCQYCGYIAKSAFGRQAHERHCDKKTVENKVNPAIEEIKNFGNTDGLSSGQVVVEEIGGRSQKVTYDRDGIGWYGPGLEIDIPVQRKPGQF